MDKQGILQDKYILFDTNILSKSTHKGWPLLKSLFDELQDCNCVLYTIDAVYFEFLSFAKNPKEYLRLKYWIENFPGLIRNPTVQDDIKQAIYLSAFYSNKIHSQDRRQISYTDCLLAAQLVKFKDKVVLLTTDFRDFPNIIFDRIKVQAIDLGDEVMTIAFIQFNLDKYNKTESDFKKAVNSI